MKNIKIFIMTALRYPRKFLATITLMIAQNIFEVGTVLSLAPVIDLITKPDLKGITPITAGLLSLLGRINAPQNIYSVMIIIMIFVILKTLLAVWVTYSIQDLKYTMGKDILCTSFKEFFSAGWNFFASHDQGLIGNTFMKESVKVVESFTQMMMILVTIARTIVYLCVAVYMSWKLSFIVLVFALALYFPISRLGSLTYRLGKRDTETNNRIFEVISESLNAAKVVLGFGEERKSQKYLSDAIDENIKVVIKAQVINNSINPVFHSVGMGIIMFLLFVSVAYFKTTVTELAVVLYSFYSALPLISQVVAAKNMLLNLLPAYEQLDGLRTTAKKEKQLPGSRKYEGFSEQISLKDVSFNYPKHDRVLRNVNISIPKGKMTALVGSSGSGKTTLVDLLLRLYDPTDGKILIDNADLKEMDTFSWRQKVGYVPQESFLFNMSLRENLRWAKDDASEEDILAACRMANATEFIERLPKGLDTVAGDRGVRLSGGQRQRIALARAILRKPDLLLLDEATSSLDSHSEKLIQEAIENISHNTTVVVVAHRLSTIKNADLIHVIEHGEVMESGSFDELMKKEGKCFELAKAQGLIG